MPPSSALPGGCKPTSSFGSVDWLSQSSRTGPAHTAGPAAVSRGSPAALGRVRSRGEPPQTVGVEEVKSSGVSALGTPTPGLSQEAEGARGPRVRTAFTAEQVSALERTFRHRRYLGPLERRKLALEMQLSEVQIKTWFQNRRMKHKRQLRASRLSTSFPAAQRAPLALCPPPSALGCRLQLLCPWASLPGPRAPAQPAGSFWGPCCMEPAPLALVWASCSRQPPMCCLPDAGGPVRTRSPALPWGAGGLCAPPETTDTF